MEIWYYIVENGKARRVSYEEYEKFDGMKYRKCPNEGVRFLNNLLLGYR